MVYRVYVEKKKEFANEAQALGSEIRTVLQIPSLKEVRLFHRYDVEGIEKVLFDSCVRTVFSEPQVDVTYAELPQNDTAVVFGAEYLPGQFDQRADSAAQCIQILSCGVRPAVRTANVYQLFGDLTKEEIAAIKKYVVNPVEMREASLDRFETLQMQYEVPGEVAVLDGFLTLDAEGIKAAVKQYGLAMDADDLAFCQRYFQREGRNPTVTELRVIDTYWSDHCRHTTFLTTIDSVTFEDAALQATYEDYLATREMLGRTKPVNLMDLATLAAKYLKHTGQLDKLDESDEINACTVKTEIEADGKKEPWLLLFKNETHNHPTEIEPFGGAATCIGGAIRDPLSGRAYVYGAMRVTGAANPLTPVSQTLAGKLPQRKIVTSAAAGYSSYGNQIGIATGIVEELYHEGYAAKRMEIGAVIAAVPAENVRREVPSAGDAVILLGGRTGRDGCGGATGSSKSHTKQSLETCGAEVQKGNAPEERKLQRLFRNAEASRLIKRCNDFGAGGVSVAIGELADGLEIDLNAVPKKYDGLDGTELAISESQERMAVVVASEDAPRLMALAAAENLEATVVARVKADPRLTMHWNGKVIVDLSREFLSSNGAEKHISVHVGRAQENAKPVGTEFAPEFLKMASDLNVCSKRGLAERFDSTIGAGTVLMPFGGKYQATPAQAMVQKFPTERKHTDDCSFMSWGYNPYLSEKSPYHGAYLAVVESVSKLIASGASFEDVYLTFQEYFERPNRDPARWGKPLAALLGAFRAQKELGVAAIGGKDSMSGSFERLDVPPTLVSFAVTTGKASQALPNHWKQSGNAVVLLAPRCGADGLPQAESQKEVFRRVTEGIRSGAILSAYTPTYGGVAEGVLKMSLGNRFGFRFCEERTMEELFGYRYGAFLLEVTQPFEGALAIGEITEKRAYTYRGQTLSQDEVLAAYESKLESVYPCNLSQTGRQIQNVCYTAGCKSAPGLRVAKPKVLIPVFPGTNCEYDSAKAVRDAGAEAEILVINNLSAEGIARSTEAFASALKTSQMIFLPGGFSGGDEPDGSGKFITAFFRNAAVSAGVTELLDHRNGLICGICNGFQALIKLGLVPYGKIVEPKETNPTLTFNTIGRHQSKIVRTKIVSNLSPWLSLVRVGDVVNVPVSHGEGRFIVPDELLSQLIANGQIATQYVDPEGNASADIRYNPNNSVCAVEGITSPDGRVFGKMGHSERIGSGLYRNVEGNYNLRMFEAAVKYFRGE